MSEHRKESWKTVEALGFGCVGLTAMESRNDALRLLDYAHDSGIRHFDTARVYGMGRSEEILGIFLKGRRDSVTVATKFGIAPPAYVKTVPFLNQIKRALKKIPIVDRRVRKVVGSGSSMNNFNPAAAKRSLDDSLKALGTDYIDVWLLHEAVLAEACNAELLEFLESLKAAGKIRQVGIGSAFAKLGSDCGSIPHLLEVLQFENYSVQPNLEKFSTCTQKYFITHSAFKYAPLLQSVLAGNQRLISNFRNIFGFDLCAMSDLCRLLLAWALRDNSSGRVLFGSTSLEHVQQNVSIFEDKRMSQDAVEGFQELLNVALLERAGSIRDLEGRA